MELTFEEFADFIREKQNGILICPVCKTANFGVNVRGGGPTPAELAIPVAPILNSGTHNFYSFSCGNCGNTQFFHSNQIENWKKSKTGVEKP